MKTTITGRKGLNILGNDNLLSNQENLSALVSRWRQKIGCFSILTALPALMASQAQAVDTGQATAPLAPADTGRAHKRLTDQRSRYSRPEFLRREGSYRLPHQKGGLDISAFTGGNDNCPGAVIPSGTYTSASPFTDTGDTTGANSTVNFLHYYYYANYNVSGPDLVYTFTMTSRGALPEIRVTPTTETYNPSIYILDSRWDPGCPNQQGHSISNWWTRVDNAGPGGAEVIPEDTMRNLPLNVPLHLFIDSGAATTNNSGSYTLRIKDVSIAPGSGTRFDVDGDQWADLAVFRPSEGVWYLNPSGRSDSATRFGVSTDKITPADFDGDRKSDVAVFRDGTWWRVNSRDNTVSVTQFGMPDDIPVPADYTGDGRADLAIYRDGQWWTLDLSNGNMNVLQFGLADDKPVSADYDGDGKIDQAIYRNGEWHLNRSRLGYTVINFGLARDIPVVGDYDGDGLAEPAVYREGTWFLSRPQAGLTAFHYGLATDIPVPADYDGDGRTDAAVYRNGDWYLRRSNNNPTVRRYGLPGDKPIPAAYLP